MCFIHKKISNVMVLDNKMIGRYVFETLDIYV